MINCLCKIIPSHYRNQLCDVNWLCLSHIRLTSACDNCVVCGRRLWYRISLHFLAFYRTPWPCGEAYFYGFFLCSLLKDSVSQSPFHFFNRTHPIKHGFTKCELWVKSKRKLVNDKWIDNWYDKVYTLNISCHPIYSQQCLMLLFNVTSWISDDLWYLNAITNKHARTYTKTDKERDTEKGRERDSGKIYSIFNKHRSDSCFYRGFSTTFVQRSR